MGSLEGEDRHHPLGSVSGYCKGIMELYKEDDMNDLGLYRIYCDALQVYVMHVDLTRARAFAPLAADVKKATQGPELFGACINKTAY